MRAAVATPPGGGPFPAVLVLHGSHGFADEYVRIAQDLSAAGVVAVAACWFSGRTGEGQRYVTPIDCPAAPPMAAAADPGAQQAVRALVDAVRSLPAVRGDRIGLFGHSRGGGAALNYALAREDVRALVLNSTGYPGEIDGRASSLRTPVLILHGETDGPAQGGSPVTSVFMAQRFERSLRSSGGRVEAHFYPGAGHNELFANARHYADSMRRARDFFARHLVRAD